MLQLKDKSWKTVLRTKVILYTYKKVGRMFRMFKVKIKKIVIKRKLKNKVNIVPH